MWSFICCLPVFLFFFPFIPPSPHMLLSFVGYHIGLGWETVFLPPVATDVKVGFLFFFLPSFEALGVGCSQD